MTFGKRLMQLRKEHGYRNRDTFAAELGIPANTLRNYEMDIREPGFPFLIKISQFFHVSTDYLLGLTEERALQLSMFNPSPNSSLSRNIVFSTALEKNL